MLVRRWLLTTFVLLTLVALVACGGGDDDDDAGDDSGGDATAARTEDSGDEDEATSAPDGGDDEAPVDVCALLTTDEVSTATEADMKPGVLDSTPPYYACDWEDELGLHSATLEILAESDEANVAYFDATTNAEPIAGLGDRAQYTDLIGLEILTDDYVVSVRVFAFDLDDAAVRERSLALGELALERLDD